MDARLFRSVMGRFATGVAVVTYLSEERPAGMTVNAFMSVSIDPPLVVISVRKQSRVNQCIKPGVAYGINILADQQISLCHHFAGKPLEDPPLFVIHESGTPLIENSLAHLVVRAVQVVNAGDHYLYLSEVEHARLGHQRNPLVFFTGAFGKLHACSPVINWTVEADCS